MVSRVMMCAIALALLLGAGYFGQAAAQPDHPPLSLQSDGLLSIGVQVPAATFIPRTAETKSAPVTWRSYVELDELRLEFDFTNESTTPLRLDQAKLREVFAFRVDRGGDVPVTIHWLDDSPDDVVSIEPETVVVLTVAIKREDGAGFGPGLYRIGYEFRNLRGAVRDPDGAAWGGRMPDGARQIAVRIQLPENAAEQGLRYILEAEESVARDQFAAALEAYSRAAAANPGDQSGIIGMAHMYRRLQRYPDAVRLYEAVFGRVVGNQTSSYFLALAYVGAGDEGNAIRVLRLSGVAESEIGTRLGELRQRVREDRSQSPR